MEFSIKKFTIDKYNCKKKKEEIINNDQSIKLAKSINYDNSNRALSWNEVYRIYQDKSYIKIIFKNSITSSAIKLNNHRQYEESNLASLLLSIFQKYHVYDKQSIWYILCTNFSSSKFTFNNR